MARGVNKAIIIGSLGSDPETRYLPSGGAVTNVTIATNEQWRDKQTNEQKERVEWHRAVFFNKLAEIAGQYLKKGSKVYVEGSLRTRKWEKDGQTHYTTEIVASELQMLDSRDAGSGRGESRPRSAEPDRGGYQAPFVAPKSASEPPPFDNFDEEIPF